MTAAKLRDPEGPGDERRASADAAPTPAATQDDVAAGEAPASDDACDERAASALERDEVGPIGELPGRAARGDPEDEPLHRLASRALLGATGAGCLGGGSLLAILASRSGGDAIFMTALAATGLAGLAAALVLCEAPIRRAPRALRLPLLALASVPVLAVVGGAPAWLLGLLNGGPEESVRNLRDLARWAMAEPWGLGLVATCTLLLGGVRIVLPAPRSPDVAARRHALAGVAIGGLLFAALVRKEGWPATSRAADALWAALLLIVPAVAAAVGLHAGERLEARLARRLAEREP